ncbi:MFS transporter [Microbacterium maritypicum]
MALPLARPSRGRHDPMNPRKSNTLLIVMILYALYTLVPLVWLLFSSTKTQAGLFSSFGLWFADDFAFMLPELFPTNVRYTGSAIAYNVSSILGAAVAPLIALWLWSLGDGAPWLVGLYLSAMGVLTFIALLLSPETKDHDYDDDLGVAAAVEL